MKKASNYRKDSIVASRFETETILLFMGKYSNDLKNVYVWADNKPRPEYDIKIIDKFNNTARIEVKAQTIYNKFNDYFFIEYEQNGVNSGINSTESDIYHIYKIDKNDRIKLHNHLNFGHKLDHIDYTLYMIPTNMIRYIIEHEKDKIIFSDYGDQKGGSKGWKIPIRLFENPTIFKSSIDENINLHNEKIIRILK